MSEYVGGIRWFVAEAQASAQPVTIALPSDRLDLVRRSLASTAGVQFVDMCDLGRNPGRVIPAVIEFAAEQEGGPTRFVSELSWPGRSAAELDEVTRHEALVGLAIESYPVKMLCPFELTGASEGAVASAWRTHPHVIVDGSLTSSDSYEPWPDPYRDEAWPLSKSPSDPIVGELPFQSLTVLRSVVHERARAAGLSEERVEDAVLAVSEAASNSVQHGGGSGVMSVWREPSDALVFEIRDTGRIKDPLVGRYPPGPDLEARGLWLVNQLADLVQIRSGEDGTVVRMTFQP